MSLLDNAVGAIQIAIEDYRSNDNRRVHAAIRNLHAGILLLCKVKLQRLSPDGSDEVLLKQMIMPHTEVDGSITWVGAGKKTVDQQAIKERFKAIKVPLEWDKLDNIAKIRNNIEHYYFSGTPQQAKEAFADACIVIRQIIMDVLHEEPAKMLGADYWSELYENKLIFDRELKACRTSLAPITWLEGAGDIPANIECPSCGSKLICQLDAQNANQHEAKFRCTVCAEIADTEELVVHVLGEVYGADMYLAAKDGGDDPIEPCPECGLETYVVGLGACAMCEFSVPDNANCSVCGGGLTAHDYYEHNGLCSYHAYVAERERDR